MSEKPADLRALLAWVESNAAAERASQDSWRKDAEEGSSVAAFMLQQTAHRLAKWEAVVALVSAALAAGEPAVPSGMLITRLYAPNPSGEPAGTTPQERPTHTADGREIIGWTKPLPSMPIVRAEPRVHLGDDAPAAGAQTCGAAPPLGGCERAPGHGGDHETVDGIAWRNDHPDAYRRPTPGAGGSR